MYLCKGCVRFDRMAKRVRSDLELRVQIENEMPVIASDSLIGG